MNYARLNILSTFLTAQGVRWRKRSTGSFTLATGLYCLIWLTGCTAPDLKPFVEASKTLSTSVKTGGELAIKPLATKPIWVSNALVQPDDSAHPYRAMEESWAVRRKTMDAVLAYGASLEAINEASASRKENATNLVGSVKDLVSAVPGYGAAFNAAGTLIIKGVETTIEVMAWCDMGKSVESADPAIQLVARVLKKDFLDLAAQFEAPLNDQIAGFNDAARPLLRFEVAVRGQRDKQRELIAANPGDVAAGSELTRLEGVYAGVAAELNKNRAEKAKVVETIAQGREFFTNAAKVVEAWASAHSEILTAFKNQRAPNFALFIARAEELKELVDQLRKNQGTNHDIPGSAN